MHLRQWILTNPPTDGLDPTLVTLVIYSSISLSQMLSVLVVRDSKH